jgi:hypothetical protein
VTNPYKPPRTWKEALRKPCIDAYQVEEENGFVCVDLAPGWRTSEGTISLHCTWSDDLPLDEFESEAEALARKPPGYRGALFLRCTRHIGVTQAHMDSALESLRCEWSDLRKDTTP